MVTPLLPLSNMAERHRGLTYALADTYQEAACVSLSRNHKPPQEFTLKNDNSESLTLVDWQPPDERCQLAWANTDDATRDGAYACALAATELALGLFAIKRAETLTGADYYIGSASCEADDLEECFRLEVSGTLLEIYEVNRRLRLKVDQALEGKSSLPAIAVVVGFKIKLISMQSIKEEP